MKTSGGWLDHEKWQWGRLVIIPAEGEKIEYAIKFDFTASNNEAEYEALIPDLQIRISSGDRDVTSKFESQLIVGQVSGEYESKEDNMRMYIGKSQELIKQLTKFDINHLPKFENQQADALAGMASSAVGLASRTTSGRYSAN